MKAFALGLGVVLASTCHTQTKSPVSAPSSKEVLSELQRSMPSEKEFSELLAKTEEKVSTQVKVMPSQAELDPILENAGSKVKDFLATLTKYRAEASELDNDRLEKDLHDFRELREMIQAAHSGTGNRGMSLVRIFGIVTSLDDAAMEAAVWSNLLTTRICGPHKQSLLFFAMAVQDNGGMLREVSSQLSHPALRLMGAADEMMLAIAGDAPKPK